MSTAPDLLALIEHLSALASGLASVRDLAGLAEEVERALTMLVSVEYNGLYLWDSREGRLRLFVARGFSEAERAEAERTAWERHPGSIFREPRTIHIPDTEADTSGVTASSARKFVVRSRLFMPVMFRDQALGVFGLASSRPHSFGAIHIAVLQFLCRLTGVVLDRIERIRASDELQRLNQDLKLARDQALAATQAKSSFLAAMSHELRTPLNAIIGYTELLLEDPGEPGSRGDLQRIQTAAHHLLELINDILDLSKIEAGKFVLHPEDLDLGALLVSVEAACRPIQRRNNNVYVLNTAAAPSRIYTDATALRRILINLLGNAQKFTHGGRVTLEIRAELRQLIFVVGDNGIGMNEVQLGRLFEAFTQGGTEITRRFGGTGLGLALTQQLVHLMGGDIEVTSVPGVGSIFTVSLPLP